VVCHGPDESVAGDYWWLIILALVGIAVVFYLMRGSKKH
jgi:cbb3-type cytochrome oxidase subunit 3